MKDPRKMASLILAVKKPDEAGGHIDHEAGPQKDGAEQDYHLGFSSSAKDLIAAVKAENEEGVVSALKDFVDLCMQAEEATPEAPSGEY